NGVSSGLFSYPRHVGDASDVRRKLHNQRTLRNPSRSVYNFVEQTRVAAELNAAMRGVRTRDVELVGGNALTLVQNFNGDFVVGTREAEDVGDDHYIFHGPQLGKLFFNEGTGANVLQSDRIQHSGRSLVEPWGRIARHRLLGQSLHHDAAEPSEMNNVFKLNAVGERAAGSNYRVFELNAREADAQVRAASVWRGAHRPPPIAWFRSRCGIVRASVNTLPMAWVGGLIPSRDANVTARSTGSACVRYVPG